MSSSSKPDKPDKSDTYKPKKTRKQDKGKEEEKYPIPYISIPVYDVRQEMINQNHNRNDSMDYYDGNGQQIQQDTKSVNTQSSLVPPQSPLPMPTLGFSPKLSPAPSPLSGPSPMLTQSPSPSPMMVPSSDPGQELINRINNDVDLSNATLSPEEGIEINRDVNNSMTIIKRNRKKGEDDEYGCSCCGCCTCCTCCTCCRFCNKITGCFITIIILCIIGILLFIFIPKNPDVVIKDVIFKNMTDTVRSLRLYNLYHTQIENYFNYRNIDFTFDFDIHFEVDNPNHYKLNFTEVELKLIYPGTNETPQFTIARSFQDYISLKHRAKTALTLPFKASLNFNDILEKGYLKNILSSCTWEINFKGFLKFLNSKNSWITVDRNKRYRRKCIVEELLNELNKEL